MKINVVTDEVAALDFALKNSSEVTVFEPEAMRRKVSELLRVSWEKYRRIAS